MTACWELLGVGSQSEFNREVLSWWKLFPGIVERGAFEIVVDNRVLGAAAGLRFRLYFVRFRPHSCCVRACNRGYGVLRSAEAKLSLVLEMRVLLLTTV
jgi:hypothetical protein